MGINIEPGDGASEPLCVYADGRKFYKISIDLLTSWGSKPYCIRTKSRPEPHNFDRVFTNVMRLRVADEMFVDAQSRTHA